MQQQTRLMRLLFDCRKKGAGRFSSSPIDLLFGPVGPVTSQRKGDFATARAYNAMYHCYVLFLDQPFLKQAPQRALSWMIEGEQHDTGRGHIKSVDEADVGEFATQQIQKIVWMAQSWHAEQIWRLVDGDQVRILK